jgi:cystathionine beta-lyase/cystathionine gamma-synthase
LAEHPALMTHGSVPAEKRKELGILDNFIRLSTGIECIEDIIEDIENSLQASTK